MKTQELETSEQSCGCGWFKCEKCYPCPILFNTSETVEEFVAKLDDELKLLQQIQRYINSLLIEREQTYGRILQKSRYHRNNLRVSDIRKIQHLMFDMEGLSYPHNAQSFYSSFYAKFIWDAVGIPQEVWGEGDDDMARAQRIAEHRKKQNEAVLNYGLNFGLDVFKGTFPLADCQTHREKLPERGAFIYFIYNSDKEIIYIGQSGVVKSRLMQHQRGKFGHEAASYVVVTCSGVGQSLNYEERKLIHIHQPKYNKVSKGWNTWSYNKWLFFSGQEEER